MSGYRSGRPVVTLWSDSYEQKNGVKTLGTTVTDVVEVRKSTTLEPTESVSKTYELGPSYDRFRSGTAAVRTFGGDRLFERTAPLEAELVIEEE
ncbi:hypothetical protein [Halostagnicola sp. A-GB9-2]|uniref:hypothetical protein n=1 Tax=Halostagnicola sp. A-GB9-2 TaxID=3048066 RepID=UPI0024C09332|nr:hypothetical protein [Halostagnicola sp. A-GB9-2]MDJ1431215.1 hypothetical protein [Halostagnicola sp. A-GB9-2]